MLRSSLFVALGALTLAACATPSDDAVQDADQTFADALGVPVDAQLPPPAAMTLTVPPVLVKGVPNTVTITNGPTVNGRVALFAGGNPANPAFCPSQLAPDCFDISAPATFIHFDRTNAAGAVTFTITPPNAPALQSGTLQAGGVQNGGQTFLSNTQAVTFISACSAPSSTFPADGDGGIVVGDNLTVTYSVPVAEYQTYTLATAAGVSVPAAVSISGDGLTATINPNASLAANLDYTLTVTTPCSQTTTVDFTTGNANAVGGYNLVGQKWSLDLSNVVITTPAFLGTLASSFLGPYDDVFVLNTIGWDGGSLTADIRFAETDPSTQTQICSETTDFPGIDLSTDPNFSFTVDEFGGIAEQVNLTGTILAGGTGVSNVNLSGYVDANEAATQAGVTPGLLCLLVGGCVTCPVSGTPNGCVFIAGTGVQTNPFTGSIEAISAADEAAGCP